MSDTGIETGLWHIHRCLLKYGVDEANREMEPLEWYVWTGRASATFLKELFAAKPFMIARKLHAGGSTDEIIRRIKKYLNWEDEY